MLYIDSPAYTRSADVLLTTVLLKEATMKDTFSDTAQVHDRFVQEYGLVPAPTGLIALWAYLWKKQESECVVDDLLASVLVTPTRDGTMPIPAAYGADSQKLLVVNMPGWHNMPTEEARFDWRPGWEWGHTEYRMIVRENGILVAKNNQPTRPAVSKDAANWLAHAGNKALLELIRVGKAPLPSLEEIQTW